MAKESKSLAAGGEIPGAVTPLPRVLVRVAGQHVNVAQVQRIFYEGDPPKAIRLYFAGTTIETRDIDEMKMLVAVFDAMHAYIPEGCRR